MSYCEYLKNTLRPLGLYELDTGIGAAELDAEGAVLDGIDALLEDTRKNMLPADIDENGVERWAYLTGFHPRGGSIEAKRESLMGYMRMGEFESSEQWLNIVLNTCGILAEVSESETKETVTVTIFEHHLEDGEEERIKAAVEAILPCHLAVEYEYA